MDDTTNQPSTTPLGHERSSTPGQDKIFENRTGESILPGMPAYTDETSLEDIAKQYTGIGGKYNDLVENAADNVGDRQVQLVGNDFGATNPYMFNTYYEPAASSFASEMRMQGTQEAAEVGLDRAEKEANDRLSAAKAAYENALAAKKKQEEERKNAKAHVSETDQSKMPEGVSEEEVNNFAKTTEGMSDAERKEAYKSVGIKEIQNESNGVKIDYGDTKKRKNVSAETKKHFGVTDEQWAKMSKEQRQAFWDRKDVGNYWTEQYMRNYFKQNSSADQIIEEQFDKMNKTADLVVDAIANNKLGELKNSDTDLAGVSVNVKLGSDQIDKMVDNINKSDKYSDDQKKKMVDALRQLEREFYSADHIKALARERGIDIGRALKGEQQLNPDQKQFLKDAMTRYVGGAKSTKEAIKEAFSEAGVDNDAWHELLEDAGAVTAGYAGLTDEAGENGASDTDKLNTITDGAYGISYSSWNALQKLKAEKPDDYTYLRDHSSFIAAGGAAAFERVTDSKKKYFLNGKWVSADDEDSPISVGDLIFHSVDGTIKEDGKYRDSDLQKFVEGYQKIYTGKQEADDETLEALQQAYNGYAKRLAASFFLARKYDVSVDEDIYNVVLALDGKGDTSKLTITNPANPNEKISIDGALQWFMSQNGDQQNNTYAAIARKAREAAGYITLSDIDSGRLYNAKIKQNGNYTIGQYGKINDDGTANTDAANTEGAAMVDALTPTQALALNMMIDNAMKEGKIDKGFLAYDGVPLGDAMLNAADAGFHGFLDFWGWLGCQFGGRVYEFVTGDANNAANKHAARIWHDMTTMDEGDNHSWTGNKDEAAFNQYTEDVRKRQADNLNHMIDTTFNIDYFDPSNTYDPQTGEVKDKDGNVLSVSDNTFFDQYGWKNFFNVTAGMAGAAAEFVAESVVTGGAGKLVNATAKTIAKGVSAVAKATIGTTKIGQKIGAALTKFTNNAKIILTATASPAGLGMAINDIKAGTTIEQIAARVGSKEAVKGVLDGTYKTLGNALDDVARKGATVIDDVASKTDDAARAAAKTVASSVDNVASESADDVAKNIFEQTATKAADVADNFTDDAAKTTGEVVAKQADNAAQALTKEEIKALDAQLQEAKQTLQKNAAIRYGLDTVADNVDNAADQLAERIVSKTSKTWDNIYMNKGLVNAMRDSIKAPLSQAAQRAAINTRLASATGIAAERIASLPDSVADVLYGVLRYSESHSDDLIHAVAINTSARRTIAAGKDIILKNIDFKKVAASVVDASEKAAKHGARLGLDDVFRIMANDLSTTPGKLMNSIRISDFMKERVKDWSRDIAQNYWTPELDQNFESHYVDFYQYITDPRQVLMGAAFDIMTTGLGRIKSRTKLFFTNAKINRIMGGVDFSTANMADAAKMQKNMIKLDNLRSKALKLNNKLMEGKVSYKKIHAVAENAENAIQKHMSVITADLSFDKQADLVINSSHKAMAEAQEALATGTLKGKREYKRILADADQFNRIMIRGNDKLMMVNEVTSACQQLSMTRFLDFNAHAQTIHKLTGHQWGSVISDTFEELQHTDFAKQLGDIDVSEKSFTGYTINLKDKELTKTIYAKGQSLLYDTMYKKAVALMGDALTPGEKASLRNELTWFMNRMVEAGNNIIDEGGKVRWNFFPTQALTHEIEPGTSSAVLAFWGFDYKGGLHQTFSGEVANPELARDQWDIYNITNKFREEQDTFSRQRGNRAKEVERRHTGKEPAEYKDVKYNWDGFDPAYAANAYYNSLDAARYVAPLVDPLNEVIATNPTLSNALVEKTRRVTNAKIAEITKRYEAEVDARIAAQKAKKSASVSKASAEHRAKLIKDLTETGDKMVKKSSQTKINDAEQRAIKTRATMQEKIYTSPMVQAYGKMFSEGQIVGDRATFVVGKINQGFNELGQDIKAVRAMLTKEGKIKKEFLDLDGNIKGDLVDVNNSLYPKTGVSDTFFDPEATQYRTMVNQLARNKNLKDDIFSPNYSRVITFEDGTTINAMAFQKDLFDVLAAKQATDLGSDLNIAQVASEGPQGPKLSVEEATISKRLQPVDVDGEGARFTLTDGARTLLENIYGDYDPVDKTYYLSGQKDTLFQDAIAKAWDDVQNEGGMVNIYDFTRRVDEHIPDFVKQAGKADTPAVQSLTKTMELLRYYEGSGGSTRELTEDLLTAIEKETDPEKKAILTDAYNTVTQLEEFRNRTTNRAGLDYSLDETVEGEGDSKRDEVLTRGDFVADENTSGQQEGFVNAWVPQGVDKNLIESADGDSVVSAGAASSNSSAPIAAARVAADAADDDIDSAFAVLDQAGKASDETIKAYDEYKKAINASDKEPVAGVTEAKGTAEKQRLIDLLNEDLYQKQSEDDANRVIHALTVLSGEVSGYDQNDIHEARAVLAGVSDDVKREARDYVEARRTASRNAYGGNETLSDADIELKITEATKPQYDTLVRAVKRNNSTDPIYFGYYATDPKEIRKIVSKNVGANRLSQSTKDAIDDYQSYIEAKKSYIRKSKEYERVKEGYDEYLNDWIADDEANDYGIDRSPMSEDEYLEAYMKERIEKSEDVIKKRDALFAKINSELGGNGVVEEAPKAAPAQAGTFEASTAGHKEFSALNAKFAEGTKIMGIDIGGRTIEDVYQKELKGSGKGKAPAKDSVLGKATTQAEEKAGKALTKAEKEAISQRYYDRLWDIWGEQNPELKAQIENLPAGTKITDQFAKTGVSQANSLQRWVKPAETIVQSTPDQKAINLKKALDIINSDPDSQWSTRRVYRDTRRTDFDNLEKEFNGITDLLESKVAGKNIATAYDILPLVKDNYATPEAINKRLHNTHATLSRKSSKLLKSYEKSYEYFQKAKKADAKTKTKAKLIASYEALAKSINEDSYTNAQKARVKEGTGIYRGTHLLRGASDRQYLAFASGVDDNRASWSRTYGDPTEYSPAGKEGQVVSHLDRHVPRNEVVNALNAGIDGFGNMTYMDPKNLDAFIKKHNIQLSQQLKDRIEAYRTSYTAKKDSIIDPKYRRTVSDSFVAMNDQLPEYLASLNEIDPATGRQVRHLLDTAEKPATQYHDEKARYATATKNGNDYTDRRVQNEIKGAERRLGYNDTGDKSINISNEGFDDNFGILDPENVNDFGNIGIKGKKISKAQEILSRRDATPLTSEQTSTMNSANSDLQAIRAKSEAKIDKLTDKLVTLGTDDMRAIKKQIDDLKPQYEKAKNEIVQDWYNNHRTEDSTWTTSRVAKLREEYAKKEAALRKKLDAVTPEEYKRVAKQIEAEYAKIDEARNTLSTSIPRQEMSERNTADWERVNTARERLDERIDQVKEGTDPAAQRKVKIDKEPLIPESQIQYNRNTPYIEWLNASKGLNSAEEAAKLNKLFYGDGNHTGFFDSIAEDNNAVAEGMSDVAQSFNESITDKITELKKLDGAKDGDLVAILEGAKRQAETIENKTVKDYVIKRLDEEIAFAKKNLEFNDDAARKKAIKSLLEHDPEYKEAIERLNANAAKGEEGKIDAHIPTGAKPVYVNGEFKPDGHISLQQILDARKVVELDTNKHGKNTLKSTKQTKEILKSMRTDFNDGYDGGSMISGGASRDQDNWILNLYTRIHNESGLDKLPHRPSYAEIEQGFMIHVEDGVETKIDLPLKLDEVYVDPQIAALGSHYWGEGTTTAVEKVYKMATKLTEFNKAVQDIQLAGGLGQYNAFTLRNAITMMWQDPIGGTRALFSNFHNARTNESVLNFYVNNHERLLKMAMDSGDWSAINGFVNVVNMNDQVTTRGVISDFGHQIAEIPNVFKEKGVISGFGTNISNLYNSIFQNPTFVRWMTVAKADMQLRNYDKATRFVGRMVRKYNLTDDDFANVEGGMGSMDKYIATIAQLRTDKYWKPSEFALKANNVKKYMTKQDKLHLKQTAESLRGMPQKKSLRSCFGDFFFAIGYKLQMNAHPIDGIATIFTALPNNIRASRGVATRSSFNVMSSRFAGRGNRNEALVMIGIAALAHAWNTYIGAPSAWEELWSSHGNTENGTYGIAQSLLNFQDFGKIWMPNTADGKFDATKRGNSIDPFFSIFTLQNSGMRAANKFFFPNQNPYNWQRTTGAGLAQVVSGQPLIGNAESGSLWDRISGVKDELIGANLLSGYKAIYEVINNNTYFGNNIWERKYLPDGTENPNYNPTRNLIASIAHILNTEEWWFGDRTNKWVKGLTIDSGTWKDGKQVDPFTPGFIGKIGDQGKYNGKTGTVAGSGIFQHEYVTAWSKIGEGDYFDALVESMELPFKSRNYESRARTQLNSEVMMALRHARQEYDRKIEGASASDKDKYYADFATKAVNIVHDWSAKNEYALGKNGELDATATKMLIAFMADEYDDVTNRIQNRYDKLRQDLKMADGDEFLFSKDAMDAAIADGMDETEAAEKHNAHLKALQEAQIKEYEARQALIEAGLSDVIDIDRFHSDYIHDDLQAQSATFDKKTFKELTAKFEQPVGEFKNYMEMKNYYEELIKNATTTKSKVKLANAYNEYITDIISPYVGEGFSAQMFNDIYWDGKNLSNELSKYIIIPADKYYSGKTPHANYLKDLLHIGWRDNKSLPSDKDIKDQLDKVNKALTRGQVSSAASLIDSALVQLRKGTVHASPEDYQKLIRMRALLSSRRK